MESELPTRVRPIATPEGWSAHAGTLADTVCLTGRGLHTGRKVTVRVLPAAPEDARRGIVFRRVTRNPTKRRVLAEFPVTPDLWRHEPLCSTLKPEKSVGVRTVEHLLAALLMCEIDSATVELDAEEVPILDGGAKTWVKAFTAAGRVALPAPKRFIRVLKKLTFEYPEDDCRYVIAPARGYRIKCRTKVRHFPRMVWGGVLTPASFAAEVAPARTYGPAWWAAPAIMFGVLSGKPIMRGIRLSSVAATFHGKVIGGMILPDELVRHRALDLIGDFAMAGFPLLGNVSAVRPAHARNHKVISALLATPDAWEWAECRKTPAPKKDTA